MATLSSKPTDDSGSHYTGLEPEGEASEVSVRPQGASDQQIAVNSELPAKFMLVHLPPTLSPQSMWARGCESLTSNHNKPHVGGVWETLAISLTSCSSWGNSKGVVCADSKCSDSTCFHLNYTGKNGGYVVMNTKDGSLTISDKGGLFTMMDEQRIRTNTGKQFVKFALQSGNYFLGVDTHKYEVKGITKDDTRYPTHCFWRMEFFPNIGKSLPPEFALQYWGADHGDVDPDTTDGYYFIIKIQASQPTAFILANKSEAAVYGRFSYSEQ